MSSRVGGQVHSAKQMGAQRRGPARQRISGEGVDAIAGRGIVSVKGQRQSAVEQVGEGDEGGGRRGEVEKEERGDGLRGTLAWGGFGFET